MLRKQPYSSKGPKRIERLEKGKTLISQCKKNGWTDISGELEEYKKTLEKERNAERRNQQKQLAKINNVVGVFQKHLSDVKPTQNMVEKLKEIMSEVEVSVNNLKEQQQSSVEEYMKEERICKQEVAACEKKFENWSLADKPYFKQITVPAPRGKLFETDLPPEVQALESFLQRTGGPTGDWDEFDHKIFIRFWIKHGGNSSYKNDVKLYVPSKSMEEIEQHGAWFQELLDLQNKKKEAIKAWKAKKNQERQLRLEQERQLSLMTKKKESSPVLRQRSREKKEVALQLVKWKEEKKKREEQQDERRLTLAIEKRRQEKEERRRQLEVKLALEEQRQMKRDEEREERMRKEEEEQRETKQRKRVATKVIKRFSERDLLKVEAQRYHKQYIKREEEERQKRIAAKLKEKVDSHVTKDRSRVVRPTKGWEERMKHIGPSGGGQVFQISHRAIPTWRQGIIPERTLL